MPPVDTQGQGPYRGLSSLASDCDTFWRDRPDLIDGAVDAPMSARGYFLFEEYAASWAEVFVRGLEMRNPLLTAPPAGVLEHLRASRPDELTDRAWLVLYYGIILSSLTATASDLQTTKLRLRANLWLAFNDTRLLMEPSDLNIQAVTFLACHVEPFTTPSLCWMLMSTACRMLIALAVNHRLLEPDSNERRLMMFWHLNVLDKAMAFIFPWPPALHRTTVNDLPMPTLNQILGTQPQPRPGKRASSFGAHHAHQIFRLSRIMAGIWCALDEHDSELQLGQVFKSGLDTWYKEAMQILEAAALTETPFLDPAGAASVQHGLDYVRFQYYGATICLTRGRARWTEVCHDTSLKMLDLLQRLVSTTDQPYLGVTWQMLYYPWAPFLVLFGEILSSKAGIGLEEKKQALHAMEKLPTYFNAMGARYHEAVRLERMASATVQRARSMVFGGVDVPGTEQVPILPTPGMSTGTGSVTPPATHKGDANQQHVTGSLPGAGPWLWAEIDMPVWPSELEDPFADAIFDWFAWDGQTQT
ncbi:hypothetical protein LTR53_004296 [Teratosphaeriaceae sp. CCFEE 6253]|nr:hypothetical protein LTR53_004296 [Teratosphaeriaceae sp. CCFEE 6253]